MSTISIDIPAKSFAICILEGIFTSTVYDPVRPEEISMSRGCSATVLLDLREAKKWLIRLTGLYLNLIRAILNNLEKPGES